MKNVRQWKDAEGRKCLGLEVAVKWDDEKKKKCMYRNIR